MFQEESYDSGVLADAEGAVRSRAAMSREEAYDLGAHLAELDLTPPPLCHQRSHDFSDAPMYRCLLDPAMGGVGAQHAPYEEYEEEPVYRSVFPQSSGQGRSAGYADEDPFGDQRFSADWGFLRVDDPRHGKQREVSPVCSRSLSGVMASRTPNFVFDFPPEIFDHVLHFLSCQPDLFSAMAANQYWRECALDNYRQRSRRVPAEDDALLHAVEAAGPGDTIYVAPGIHRLSRELAITVPVRIMGPSDGDPPAVLCSDHHVVLRTRAEACLQGLTLCRMGDSVGYPNAVVFAEAGRLNMVSCRITCGGDAPTVDGALRNFDAAPSPGGRSAYYAASSPTEPPTESTAARAPEAASASEGRGQDRPQSGLWIGAASQVTLRDSIIAGTMGPGVKVYRGELEAHSNTIAFSSRGANVVANGGKMLLSGNHIEGATGDGISSWNNTHMTIEGNRICANTGSGITINSSGGRVVITGDNLFSANGAHDVHRPSEPMLRRTF